MATQQAPTGGVSLRPSTFSAGGSLVDDVDVTFTRVRFGFGYGESKGNAQADESVTLQTTMVDGEGTEHLGYYSVGNGFVPSEAGSAEENGKFLVPVGDKTAPSGSSNFALMLNSFINAGLPEDLLDSGDISALEGTKAHVNRVPAPKRTGLPARNGPNAQREVTILLVTSVISLPGEAPKATAAKKGPVAVAGGKTAAATAKASAAPAADVSDITGELEGELLGLFAAAGVTEMKKVDLVKAIFNGVEKTQANRGDLMKAAAKDEVLKAMDSFTFDGKVLKAN